MDFVKILGFTVPIEKKALYCKATEGRDAREEAREYRLKRIHRVPLPAERKATLIASLVLSLCTWNPWRARTSASTKAALNSLMSKALLANVHWGAAKEIIGVLFIPGHRAEDAAWRFIEICRIINIHAKLNLEWTRQQLSGTCVPILLTWEGLRKELGLAHQDGCLVEGDYRVNFVVSQDVLE